MDSRKSLPRGAARRTNGVVIEKRVHPRVVIDTTLSCRRKDGSTFTAMAKDISVGGMFVLSEQSLSFGEELSITIRLPGAKQDFVLPAVVRWTKPGGFGVQFGLLGARETHAISELMRA